MKNLFFIVFVFPRLAMVKYAAELFFNLIGLVSNCNVQLVELRKFFLKTVSI